MGEEKTLFPHQLKAIEMMEEREKNKKSLHPFFQIELNTSVYADITGFGKTLVVLELISRDKMEWEKNKEYIHTPITGLYGNGTIVKKSLLPFRRLNSTLIIINTTVVKQWMEELEEKGLSFTTIYNRKSLIGLDPNNYQVVLCGTPFLQELIVHFKGFSWKRVVFDEPTSKACHSSKFNIVAGFTWFITSSPQLLLKNTKHCLNGIFTQELDYTVYKNMIIKNDDQIVLESFSLPPVETKYYKTSQPVYTLVQNLFNPMVKEMVSQGKIEQAVRCLGGNTTSNLLNLLEKNKKECLQRVEWKRDRFERLGDQEKFHKWKEKALKIKREISQLQEKMDSMISSRCPVCLEPKQNCILLTCCHNMFCGNCVLDWFQKNCSCPLCRKKITTAHLVYYKPGLDTTPLDSFLPSKTKIILDVLQNKKETKILIFSSFHETFDVIRHFFQENNISYGEIKGNMLSREKIIQEFKTGHLNVLFLNSHESCTGLNLQETTDLFFYHPVTEPLFSQIKGRAYRIGRVAPLTIHCF